MVGMAPTSKAYEQASLSVEVLVFDVFDVRKALGMGSQPVRVEAVLSDPDFMGTRVDPSATGLQALVATRVDREVSQRRVLCPPPFPGSPHDVPLIFAYGAGKGSGPFHIWISRSGTGRM